MALVVTFRVPVTLCANIPGYGTPVLDAAGLKAAVKATLETGLTVGEVPQSVESVPFTTPAERVNLSVPENHAQKVRDLAKVLGVPDSIACQQVVMAGLRQPASLSDQLPNGSEAIQKVWQAIGKDQRPAQATVFVNLQSALAAGDIGLIEAATGTGKTLAMLLAANAKLDEDPDNRVVISTPTISLIRQFLSQHAELVRAQVPVHPIRAIVGRREFVSKSAVEDLLTHAKYQPFKQDIERWLGLGGEPLPGQQIQQHYLVATLKQIAPDFPAEVAVLDGVPDNEDPGWRAYAEQFAHDEYADGEIVLATHAMLSVSTKIRLWTSSRNQDVSDLKQAEQEVWRAIGEEDDVELRKELVTDVVARRAERVQLMSEIAEGAGKLPRFRYLLLDEAHAFEQSMANATANYLSLHAMVRSAEACASAGVMTKDRLTKLKKAVESIAKLGTYLQDNDIDLHDGSKLGIAASELLSELAEVMQLKRGAAKEGDREHARHIASFRFAATLVRLAALNQRNTRAYLQFSPVKAFPQLCVGNHSVNSLLEHLWVSIRAGACVSATLYLPRADTFSASFQRRILNVPQHRAREFTPVTPPWVFAPVHGVWLPEYHKVESRTWLRPPTRADKLSADAHAAAEDLWLSDVATFIASAYQTAAGGSMVLMTSYATVQRLSSKLKPLVQTGAADVIVAASPGDSLTDQTATFLRMRKDGIKAIWLATGGAWTGLDVGGHDPWRQLFGAELPAEFDNVLTDLFIPRIPYGLNKSLTHATRIEKEPSVPWELLDSIFRMKQGIGRLIRRMGLPQNRRIFIMDARMNDTVSFKNIRHKIESMIKHYSRLPPEF